MLGDEPNSAPDHQLGQDKGWISACIGGQQNKNTDGDASHLGIGWCLCSVTCPWTVYPQKLPLGETLTCSDMAMTPLGRVT